MVALAVHRDLLPIDLMLRQLVLLVLFLVMLPLALAGPQSDDEMKFREAQAKELNKYAGTAFKDGFPGVAKNIWLMLLSEYDPDNKIARESLGYQKSGKTWVKKPGFQYPKNDTPNASRAASLKKKWAVTESKIAKAHKRRALEYDKAGRTDLAEWHWKKVIYFAEDDLEAQAALNRDTQFEGLTGTSLEKDLYDRSKLIEAVVEEETRKQYDVERVEIQHPFLDRANVKYVTVKSEHFRVHGDFALGVDETGAPIWNYEIIENAAINAERAIRVMQRLTEGMSGFNPSVDTWLTEWAFFQSPDTYKQVLEANRTLMSDSDYEFRKENSTSCALFGEGGALLVAAAGNEQTVYDSAVRSVAQAYGNVRSDGIREGFGHAIVGMFFNYNRLFAVDNEEQQRSSTGEDDPGFTSPDMEIWKELALEMAWQLGEVTPAAALPLMKAADFPNDARIKSWSFCDYLIRRDPTLVVKLDRLSGEPRPAEVSAKFREQNDGLALEQLEKEWKDFWTEASPVLKAIRDNTEPLSSINKDVEKWLKAFNDARVDNFASTRVLWRDASSGRCAEHARYLLLNEEERGAAAEHMEKLDLEGASHFGDIFAHMAIVETDAKKPKDVFKRWMGWPGYRDALLNNALRTVGLFVEDGVLVMDVIRGVGSAEDGKGGTRFYPKEDTDLPDTEVDVSELGPEVKELLVDLGYADKEKLGYPLSLHHFGTGGLAGARGTYTVTLMNRDEPIEGIIHVADGGENRRSSAPGMVVFYPLDPLPRGKKLTIKWNWENKQGGTDGKKFDFST